MVVFDEAGLPKKPDPVFHAAIVEAAGVPADRIAYVGDSPAHDVLGPQRAGLRVIWLNRPGLPRRDSCAGTPVPGLLRPDSCARTPAPGLLRPDSRGRTPAAGRTAAGR
ncbi:HAD family hydrolase [Micromonospora sp. NPDC092111]|uniref:HAD family hydrolase n=1 Tax=Micromonospora sp. NPDC092111 TaxID=3364289 RepID=UPI0037F56ECD